MQHIVLLRGINIGGRKIKMDDLKACLEKDGFTDVKTVLQTGNVILNSNQSSDKLHKSIENTLFQTFDFPIKIMVLSPKKMQQVVNNYPFTAYDETFHRYAIFTAQENITNLSATYTTQLDNAIEAIQSGEGVLYWAVQKGQTLNSLFGKSFNHSAKNYFLTNRNLNTLEKILAKCQ